MVYTNDVNIIGESVHIIQKRPEDLLVASKEIVLKVTANKTKHMFMLLDQNLPVSYSKLRYTDF